MTVGIIGSKGNMGRRYSTILSSLGVDWIGFDLGYEFVHQSLDTYIVATPTATHMDIVEKLGWNKRVKILIEKPVVKVTQIHPPAELWPVRRSISRGNQVFMVNQYAYYPGINESKGDTIYDYYKSGDDGLGWDCIQLLQLAKGSVFLSNQSPVWFCSINGLILSRDVLDRCYVEMVNDFLNDGKKLWGWNEIRNATEKSYTWQKDFDRRASEK